MLHPDLYDAGQFCTPARRTFGARNRYITTHMEKETRIKYEAPAVSVVDVRTESCILASSGNAHLNFFYDEEDF